jgi:hypothetical protein
LGFDMIDIDFEDGNCDEAMVDWVFDRDGWSVLWLVVPDVVPVRRPGVGGI